MKINVTLTFEVDPETWSNEYGMDIDDAKEDVRDFLPDLVRGYVTDMPHVLNGIVGYRYIPEGK